MREGEIEQTTDTRRCRKGIKRRAGPEARVRGKSKKEIIDLQQVSIDQCIERMNSCKNLPDI